jgi:pectate lyase
MRIKTALVVLILAATAWAAHTVNLSWAAVPYATGYDVYRSEVSGGPYKELAVVATPAYSDTTAQAGKTYYYVTTSVSKAGQESAYSQEITVKVPTP